MAMMTARERAVREAPWSRATLARASVRGRQKPAAGRCLDAPATVRLGSPDFAIIVWTAGDDARAWRARPDPGRAYSAVPAGRGRTPC